MSVTVASGNNTGLPDQTKIAADVVGTGTAPGTGDLVPYVKLDLGATGDSAPVEGTLPVSGTVAVSNLPATQPVSAAALPLPAGASTEATLAAIKAKTDNIDVLLSTRTKPADVQHVDGSGVTQPVSGTVAVNNFPATQPVSGTVTLAADEAHIGEVGGPLATPSAPFTRPADTTAYAVGDLMANNTVAGSVVPLSWTAARVAGGSFLVRRARIAKTSTSVANAVFRLHLYATDPSAAAGITNGDNGAWLTKTAGYVGSFDVTLDKVFSDGSAGTGVLQSLTGSEISVHLASGQTLYGLLEARAAYAPASAETFTVVVELLQN
jgi:hypothetical protein